MSQTFTSSGQTARSVAFVVIRIGIGVDEGRWCVILGAGGEIWEEMGAEMLFTGSFRRALDDKQRLPIPRSLREEGHQGVRFYVTPGLDGCLALYPEDVFTALGERLAAASPAAREIRDYSRLFYSQAACVVLDRQWRFRLPPELTKWAGLAGDVMIVGVRDHLEVWALEKWEQYVSRCDPQYDQLAEMALIAPLRAGHETGAAIPNPLPSAAPPIAADAPSQPR